MAVQEQKQPQLNISSDGMEAYLRLPVPSLGEPYTEDKILQFLSEKGVCVGIQKEAIKGLLDAGIYERDVRVAVGTKPVDGTDGYYEYEFNSDFSKKPKIREDGTVDYWSMNLIEVVREGQEIAKYHPAVEAKAGVDVKGRPVTGKHGRELPPLKGKGFERDLNEINVEDVESFTVLKDASATAIYGSKGANGVILINTRRGKEGKININAKVETFYSMFTQLPEFVDGYTYASMANEAKTTRNQEPLYQPEELELFRLGLDPDLYPDVDWMDLMLRDGAWSTRASLNMTGGGKTARYYVGGSYQDQQGMYKTDKSLKNYNTNANFRKWTYRMNVDIDITKSTLLKVGVSGSLRKQNDPGVGTDAIWTTLMGYNSIMMPVTYSDGKVSSWTAKEGNINPWVQATMTGYNESWKNNIQTNVTLEQKLDFITKGLKFIGRFGYDTENSNWIKRVKWPELYKAEPYRDVNGDLIFTRLSEEKKMTQTSGSSGKRNEFFEWELHYDRGFKDHHVGAVLRSAERNSRQRITP